MQSSAAVVVAAARVAVGLVAETEAAGLVACSTAVAVECCCSWSAGTVVVETGSAVDVAVVGCTPGSVVETEEEASAAVAEEVVAAAATVAVDWVVAGWAVG